MPEETIEQVYELRAIEHEQMILSYIEQVPQLAIPTETHRKIVNQMMMEYNEKYFGDKKQEPAEELE